MSKLKATIQEYKMGNHTYQAVFHGGGMDKGFKEEQRLQEYVEYLKKIGYEVKDERTGKR